MARITFSTMYDTTMHYLQRNGNELHKIQEQIASEQMINRPSDNPIGFTNALNYRNILNSLEQQRFNMDDGEIYMTILDVTLQSINGIFGRSQELAVQMANDTTDHQARLFTNMEVREHLNELVALAQSKHKDDYIFSGKWTNQPPYEIKNGAVSYPFYNYAGVPDYRGMPTDILMNAPSIPPDPNDLRPFEGTPPITIQLFDANYIDPNIKPIPDHPMVQRVIPGTLQIAGDLLEVPHRNTDLPEDHPDYDKPDYDVDYVNGTITLLSERAKAAFYAPNAGDPSVGNPSDPPAMNFEYVYRNSIDMSGEIYREIDSGITMKINANPDDLFGKSGVNDTDSFKEIIAFMQGLWHNDQPQISKSIDTLDAARERNLEQQAIEGAKLNRVAIVFDRNKELEIANSDARSRIEDVNFADALTQFTMAEAVYNASLQAAARLMQRSLMDYL